MRRDTGKTDFGDRKVQQLESRGSIVARETRGARHRFVETKRSTRPRWTGK